MKKLKHITQICEEIYYEKGASGVYEHVLNELNNENPAYKDVQYIQCTGCEAETPHWKNTCLICGLPNS